MTANIGIPVEILNKLDPKFRAALLEAPAHDILYVPEAVYGVTEAGAVFEPDYVNAQTVTFINLGVHLQTFHAPFVKGSRIVHKYGVSADGTVHWIWSDRVFGE